ncbi:MAG: hypothetical protein R6X32_02035 [Chloroflexota bacterium]
MFKALFLLLFSLSACQNVAEPVEDTPQPDMAEVVLPDEHLILATDPTPMPTNTPEITPTPTIMPTPTSPPLFQVQDGTLLVRDEESGNYAPDPTFPQELQGQAASVRYFAGATGRYWVTYDGDNQAIAERFSDEEDTWINLLTNAVAEEPLFNPGWDRELIGFSERDLVIVDETAGIDNFEFLFVHSEWATQQAVIADYHIVSVEQLNKTLNYLRATAANQGLVAITENGLEIVPSKLPPGWHLQPDETGTLQLLDSESQVISDENPHDYLLFDRITIVISTRRPAMVLPMYRNTEDESETRHFLQGEQLLVHHYMPERQLSERYIKTGGDWQIAALGLSQAGVLLANPRELLAYLQHAGWRGQLNRPPRAEGTILVDFYEWYVEGPQRFDHYLLGRDPLHDLESLPEAVDLLLEAETDYHLRFRLGFAAE